MREIAIVCLLALGGCAPRECVIPKSAVDFISCQNQQADFLQKCLENAKGRTDISSDFANELQRECLFDFSFLLQSCKSSYDIEKPLDGVSR